MKFVSLTSLAAWVPAASSASSVSEHSVKEHIDGDGSNLNVLEEPSALKSDLEMKSKTLRACFETNGETDGSACWENCVFPAFDAGTTCEGIGMDIEMCRIKTCSSGSACKKEYYSALNWAVNKIGVVEGCTFDGSQYAPPPEGNVDQCDDKDKELISRSKALISCYETNGETDGSACWESCVSPALETGTTCEGISMDIEECRIKKCSSGSACKKEYYSALKCAVKNIDVVEGCTLDGSQYVPPPETNVDQCDGKDLMDISKALLACFEENGESNGGACWEDCVERTVETGTTCEGMGMNIERCRSEKCSSGSACKSEYYSAFNCAAVGDAGVVGECTLDGSQYAPPSEAPVDQCDAKDATCVSEGHFGV